MLGTPSHNSDKSKLGHMTLYRFPFQAFEQGNCERIESSRVSKFVSFFSFFFLLRCAVSLVPEKCVSESACGDERKGPPSSFPPRDSPTESLFHGCQMTSCFIWFKIISCTLFDMSGLLPSSELSGAPSSVCCSFVTSVVSLQWHKLVFSQQTTLPLSPSNITSHRGLGGLIKRQTRNSLSWLDIYNAHRM